MLSLEQLCYDLACRVLSNVNGADAMDKQELADAIKLVCEDHCRSIAGFEGIDDGKGAA